MSTALFIPMLIGMVSVLQATLNRDVARQWGLAPAAVLNMLVALGLALAFVAYSLGRSESVGIFRIHMDASLFRWWWLLPGVFGCLIVFGLPWAVEKLGALPVFVVLIAAQMSASAGWDRFVDGVPMSPQRALGALLMVVSAVLVSWK